MPRVVRIHAPGPPSALVVDDLDVGAPASGEARVRHTAVGVNFLDVYHRSGAYKLALPSGIGVEGVGVVEAVGAGVGSVLPGDRVAYAWSSPGAYAEARLVPAGRLIKLPADIPDETAAAMLSKGLTAEFLLRRTFRVDASHTVVIYAAAGGVGSILVRWARAIGAKVIGVVSTDEKARTALRLGAHHVLTTTSGELARRVRELTDGRGVDVVYDSVGKDTFAMSLDMLRARGTLVSFGQASGPVPPLAPSLLAEKGSLFLTRPRLHDYTHDPGEYRAAADALFDAFKKGNVGVEIAATFPLLEAARAHEALESRRTQGSLVLVP